MVARVVGVLAVLAGGLTGGSAGALFELTLSETSGPVGASVTASQPVDADACTVYTVFFDGAPVGSDDGSDGEAEVTFEVPDVEPDDYDVVAECEAGEEEQVVGQASFAVVGVLPTSSLPTTIGPTTSEQPASTTTTDEPTATTEDTVTPPPENITECEDQAAEAEGRLVYQPERDMVVGRTYEVAAALSLEGLPDVTFDGTTTVIVVTDLRCTIRADLVGSDFAISPKSDFEQSFIDTRELDWRWDVRPLRSGDDLELTLRFQVLVREDGLIVPGRSTLHEAIIDVDAEARSFWTRLNDGAVGFLTHPVVAPATAVIVAGLVTWLGRKAQREVAARRARARASAAAGPPPPGPVPGPVPGPDPDGAPGPEPGPDPDPDT